MRICMNACAPVLFLVFNRPEPTRRVFEAIRAARPQRLYVAADGPRLDRFGEREHCLEVRTIATDVDWPCELHTYFFDANQGCRNAVSKAISWFFGAEQQGIVLEDDCLPSCEFFPYATSLLDYYQADSRIMKINGFNPFGAYSSSESYFYSHFGYAWGWASWSRAWRYFDSDVNALASRLSAIPCLPYPFYRDRLEVINDLKNGLDTWDFQWEFAISSQHGLQIVPSKSLICNLGFGPDASHTLVKPRGVYNVEAFSSIMPLTHPDLMLPDAVYEQRLLAQGRASFRQRIKALAKSFIRF